MKTTGAVAILAALAALLAACVDPDATDTGETQQATTVCGGSATVHGMDVSVYETSIDFAAAKAAGIDFAFIRASDGSQYVDPKFAGYWAAAKAAGVMRGAYQFFRPEEDPIAQADMLLAAMGSAAPGDLPPVIDVEVTDGLTAAEVATAVQAWVDHVSAAIGRAPIVYAGFYSWQDDAGGLDLSGYPLWHAQYTDEACPNIPVPWTQWTFWQYTSTGSVPDVEGELTDLDVFDGTLADLQAFAAGGPPACGTIAAAGGEIDDGDACFSAGGPAATLRDVTTAGEGGSLLWTKTTDATAAGNFARWDLELAEAGTYRVEVYTAAAYAQATTAAYRVVTEPGDARQLVVIDQTAVDGWQSLGDFALAAGGQQWIELADDTGVAGQQLVFDAVRLTRVDPDAGSGSDGSAGSDRSGGEADRERAGCAAAGGGGGGLLVVAALLVSASRARRGSRSRARRQPRTATRRP